MTAAGCSIQFVLPNRTPLPATREAGLVQIANARFQPLRLWKSASAFHEKAGLCQVILWLGKFISDVFLCPDIR